MKIEILIYNYIYYYGILLMVAQLAGALHILSRAYHANNAINVLNIGMGLSALDNTHFLRWYLLHDRVCKNHAENAINASTRNLRTGLRLTQRFGGGRWES